MVSLLESGESQGLEENYLQHNSSFVAIFVEVSCPLTATISAKIRILFRDQFRDIKGKGILFGEGMGWE